MEGNGADIGFLYFIELKHNEKVYYIQYGTYAHIDESLNVVNGFDTDVVNLNSSGIKRARVHACDRRGYSGGVLFKRFDER